MVCDDASSRAIVAGEMAVPWSPKAPAPWVGQILRDLAHVYDHVLGELGWKGGPHDVAMVAADTVGTLCPRHHPAFRYVRVVRYNESDRNPFITYATVGLSLPWDLETEAAYRQRVAACARRMGRDQVSGLGVELCVRGREQDPSVPLFLQQLALWQLAIAAQMTAGRLIESEKSVPLREFHAWRRARGLADPPWRFTSAKAMPPSGSIVDRFETPTGQVELIQLYLRGE